MNPQRVMGPEIFQHVHEIALHPCDVGGGTLRCRRGRKMDRSALHLSIFGYHSLGYTSSTTGSEYYGWLHCGWLHCGRHQSMYSHHMRICKLMRGQNHITCGYTQSCDCTVMTRSGAIESTHLGDFRLGPICILGPLFYTRGAHSRNHSGRNTPPR